MITLNFPDGGNLPLNVDDNSFRQRAVMGDDSLNLSFSLPEHREFPTGTTCEFQGTLYTLEKPASFRKNGSRNYEYSLVMESEQSTLGRYILHSIVPGDLRIKFSYTGKPEGFLHLITENLNEAERLGGGDRWSYDSDDIVQSVEKSVAFSCNTCMEALKMVAEEFGTEWEIVNRRIYLHKVGYNVSPDQAIALSYGKGNGFLPGIGKAEYSSGSAVGILYVQGGSRNIDPNKYRKVVPSDGSAGTPGSNELRLPSETHIWYDGSDFYGSAADVPDGIQAVEYVTDRDGLSVRRASGQLSRTEGCLDLSDIYPMREGVVGEVIPPSISSSKLYEFRDTDSNIPDYGADLIEGNTLSIIFQEGMLAGKEFQVNYTHPGLFKIIGATIDNVEMPNEQFCPVEGQKYAVFNAAVEGLVEEAERKLLQESVKYLWEHEKPRFTFTGTVDPIWAKRNWMRIGPKLIVGGHVLFSDTQFLRDGELIRITGIKEYVNNRYSPEVELSNETKSTASYYSALRKVETADVAGEANSRRLIRYTERRFRDVKETTEMLRDSLLDFSEGINPVTVRTMQTVVGDEALQFRFLDDSGEVWDLPVGLDGTLLRLPSARLEHMTIGREKQISPSPSYRRWRMGESDGTLDLSAFPDAASFYLYAVVPKSESGEQTGEYALRPYRAVVPEVIGQQDLRDTGALPFDGGTVYNLLVGIINSEADGKRSIVRMYGFTEILPGRITTDTLVSADGKSNINLAENSFAFSDGKADGNSLTWGAGKLKVKGEIDATSGKIGGFDIREDRLVSTGNSIVLRGTDGSGHFANQKINWDVDGDLKVGPLSVEDNMLTINAKSSNSLIRITDKKIAEVIDPSYTIPELSTTRYEYNSVVGSRIELNYGTELLNWSPSGNLVRPGYYYLDLKNKWLASTNIMLGAVKPEAIYANCSFDFRIHIYDDTTEVYKTSLKTVNANSIAQVGSYGNSKTDRMEWAKVTEIPEKLYFEKKIVLKVVMYRGYFNYDPKWVAGDQMRIEGDFSIGLQGAVKPYVKETVIAGDGILIQQNADNQFLIQQRDGSISVSIQGLPTNPNLVDSGELYRDGNYLMIKD